MARSQRWLFRSVQLRAVLSPAFVSPHAGEARSCRPVDRRCPAPTGKGGIRTEWKVA
ncbi:hypothetical protein BC834DRAFT_884310 [Gloeopeniophorella convolvens]|nr:hypothetical protein BC834DRAFT_884310 [Gloeopeniophorella convolvens]